MMRRASASWLGAAAQALLLLTTLGGCSEDTAYVHVTFKQLPAGASRLLLSVKLGSAAASQLDPLQLPAEPLTEATLGVRLPRSPQVERLLVLSAGVLDAGKCLLASGVGEQDLRWYPHRYGRGPVASAQKSAGSVRPHQSAAVWRDTGARLDRRRRHRGLSRLELFQSSQRDPRG
jgi:hypothetical protein